MSGLDDVQYNSADHVDKMLYKSAENEDVMMYKSADSEDMMMYKSLKSAYNIIRTWWCVTKGQLFVGV